MPLITRLLALALLATLALPARAQTVYICTVAYHHSAGTYLLGTLALHTGVFHVIATNKRYENVRALGFGANGKLYALCHDRSAAAEAMDEYLVDTTTGEMTRQKRFINTKIYSAGADSKGVFTGFLKDVNAKVFRLFMLDPVAQSLQVGAPTLVQPVGMAVPNGLGNVYTSSRQKSGSDKEKLANIVIIRSANAVRLGKNGAFLAHTGFFFHGLLYALGEEVHFTPSLRSPAASDYSVNYAIYTLNLTTGKASLVVRFTLPNDGDVMAAALAPDAEAAANSPARRGIGNAHQ